ncbi:MAG: hypothetical protein COC17_02600 [Hyphomicrobiales bacterium]|nr:DUF2852 domain-containing protein [Hyphomicrobiales bacterium]PCH51152.1 MAG: hypothetical protein COC17_02600 [Hyphomicrobiales bacterium]
MNTTYENTHDTNRSKANSFTQALIKPAWTPATIAMMIIGFMIFWPLGMAMIAYILWGDRLDGIKNDVNRATDSMTDTFRSCGRSAGFSNSNARTGTSTGNAAFDDWREVEIARLEEERRKLEETRREFDSHLRELRRAKDKEEFNSFMDARSGKTSKNSDKKPKTVPKIK